MEVANHRSYNVVDNSNLEVYTKTRWKSQQLPSRPPLTSIVAPTSKLTFFFHFSKTTRKHETRRIKSWSGKAPQGLFIFCKKHNKFHFCKMFQLFCVVFHSCSACIRNSINFSWQKNVFTEFYSPWQQYSKKKEFPLQPEPCWNCFRFVDGIIPVSWEFTSVLRNKILFIQPVAIAV